MTRLNQVALVTFAAGFVIEGATEAYQFFSIGYLNRGWIGYYYIGLATTVVGLYLMYRGQHEWTEAHRRKVRAGHRLVWTAVVIFAGATVAIAILGRIYGGPGSVGPPSLLAWVVGGLVALSFGTYFLGLVALVEELVGRLARVASWVAFGWSLGVAVLTGWVVGNEFTSLLRQFFTDPLLLIASFAPLAFVIAPLFVSYFLFAAVYFDGYRHLVARGPPKTAPEPRTEAGPVESP
jgi:hypothetical protein